MILSPIKIWQLIKLLFEALRIIKGKTEVPPVVPQKPLDEPTDPTEYMGKQSD